MLVSFIQTDLTRISQVFVHAQLYHLLFGGLLAMTQCVNDQISHIHRLVGSCLSAYR